MALRKFNKYMKLVAVIVMLSIVLSSLYAGYSFISNWLTNSKQVVAKVENVKIYEDEYLNEYNNLKKQVEAYSQRVKDSGNIDKENYKELPDEVLKEIALKNSIDRAAYNLLSDRLKIKISKADINEQLEQIENQVGGENQLLVLLAQNRTNLTRLKADIEQSLLEKEIQKRLLSKHEPTDEDLMYLYNIYKYQAFSGLSFEEAKESVKSMYLETKLPLIQNDSIDRIYQEGNISIKDENLKTSYDELVKEVYNKDGYTYMKKDILEGILSMYVNSKVGYTEELESKVVEGIDTELQKNLSIVEKAKEAGVKVNEDLQPKYQIEEYLLGYFYHMVTTYNPGDSTIKDVFNNSNGKYDIPNTIIGKIIGKTINPSEEDKKLALENAEKVKGGLTTDNFASMATLLSTDTGTKENGGSLGEVNLNQLVEPFALAVVNGKAGEIVGPVETVYGYHIIYIQSKNEQDPSLAEVSHILLPINISEKTRDNIKKELEEVKEELQKGTILWTNITEKYTDMDIREDFSKVQKDSALPVIGYETEILDKLFEIKKGDFVTYDNENYSILIQKTDEIDYKKVTFEEVKEQIRLELAFRYAALNMPK